MRRWLVVAGAALAAAVVAFVVLLGGGSSAGTALAEAAGNVEGESMRVRFAMDIGGPDGAFAFDGEGVSTADGSRIRMAGDVTLEGERPLRMTMLMVRDELWMRTSQDLGVLPPGKRWIHVVDRTVAPETLTPSEYVRFLRQADDVEEVGQERVRGQETTIYRGAVDAMELAEATSAEAARRLEAAIGDRDVKVPMEVWVSRDGLPLRFRMRLRAADGAMDLSADVLEYGVPVDVEPPPARRVVEDSALG